MKSNIAMTRPVIQTHEGAPARHITPLQQLRRTLLSCLLFEREFYEDGETIADRIREFAHLCDPKDVSELAIEARTKGRLRHAPLLLARELARHPAAKGRIIGDTIYEVIQRADELAEFLALYWGPERLNSLGPRKLSAQVKKGLARAFRKFDAYQLAKYSRDGAVKLRDVLFLVHAKPKDDEQAAVWKKLVDGTLESPNTWEVALSAGADKRETFERLINEGKLGYMALLRNLRNMQEAGVDRQLVMDAIMEGAERSKALPFRFIAAAKHAPTFEPVLDEAMQHSMNAMEPLLGTTVVLVDHSGSMNWPLSGKSEMRRTEAACGVAVMARGLGIDARVFAFSMGIAEVAPRRGLALVDAIQNSMPMTGTNLGAAVQYINDHVPYDRLIVITDEQSHQQVPNPKGRGYMVNVASARNGVGYGPWVHIDGFSEAVIGFIREYERNDV